MRTCIKYFVVSVFFSVFVLHVRAQDTLTVDCQRPVLLNAGSGISYVNIPDSLGCDSFLIVKNSQYFKLVQDKQSCKTFIQLYQMYRNQVKSGDKEVAEIVDSYESIIKTKDSAYTVLFKEYYTLNGLLTNSISKTEQAIDVSNKALDSLGSTISYVKSNNEKLRDDLDNMKKQNDRNKWKFGGGGLLIGILIGILLL